MNDIIIYKSPYKYNSGKEVPEDLLSGFFRQLSPMVEVEASEDYMIVARSACGWVCILDTDEGYDYTVPITRVASRFFVDNRIIKALENVDDYDFFAYAVGELLSVVPNAVAITFNREDKSEEGICCDPNYSDYCVELEGVDYACSCLSFDIVEAPSEKIQEFVDSSYAVGDITEEYEVLVIDAEHSTDGISGGMGDVVEDDDEYDEDDEQDYYEFPSFGEAKREIKSSVMKACREMGTELPKGAIAFRRLFEDDVECEVALKFDSMETVAEFCKHFKDTRVDLDFGLPKKIGDDVLIVYGFDAGFRY